MRTPTTLVSSKRVRRMVDELVLACEQNLVDEIGVMVILNCYASDEGTPTYAEDAITGTLIEFLRTQHIAEVLQSYTHTTFPNLDTNGFIFATELRCKVLNRRKLISLADQIGLAQDKSWSGQIDPVTGEHKITDKFSIQSSGLVTYEGRLIDLEPQVAKIVGLIMARAQSKQYSSLETITDECLGEAYLANVASKGEATTHNYIRRCISDARGKFRAATRSSNDKDFFPNRHSVGYIFEP